jgi:hypothetical protein
MDPANPVNGGKGVTSGGYWVGQIPIRITSGSTTVQTQSYCMDFDRTISIGSTYTASLTAAADNAEWRAVSYVLSWNNPATNSEAAAAQVAVWRLLNQTRGTTYFRESWLDQSIDNAGNVLATAAWGKDVVRQGDVFSWVSPIVGNMSMTHANPGATVIFTAQLATAQGAPRSNVLVQFNATLNDGGAPLLLNSTYVSPASAYTDSQGRVQVAVTVPSNSAIESTITVEAATKSVWPQRYIDLGNPATQDLIGMGETFQLTLTTNVALFGFIVVLPESSIGSIAAIGAFAAAFAAYVKIKQHKKPAKP